MPPVPSPSRQSIAHQKGLGRVEHHIVCPRCREVVQAVSGEKSGRPEAVSRLAKQGLALALTPEAKEFIGNQGYDPVYGARPLKRAIQHLLLDPLSLDVLDGKFTDGDVIQATVEHGHIAFTTA